MVNAVTNKGHTALHGAAYNGDGPVFRLVLAANPALIDATTNAGWTVLHLAALQGHLALVSFLLQTKNATLVNAVTNDGLTAMHCAAKNGHLAVVKLLHTASPGLIYVTTAEGVNAVHVAILGGHSAVALYLLAEAKLGDSVKIKGLMALHSPGLTAVARILARSVSSLPARGPLHEAALNGHVAVVKQLLDSWPSLIASTTYDGRTPLHVAAASHESALVSYLLRENPELISIKDNCGNTPLHMLAEYCCSRETIEAMWRLYPEALRAANSDNDTPFHTVVAKSNHCAIKLFQWSLTWEEIKSAYDKCKVSYVERFRPVLETQCEGLSVVLLPDVVATVFEYLGFERVKRSTITNIWTKKGAHWTPTHSELA